MTALFCSQSVLSAHLDVLATLKVAIIHDAVETRLRT